MGNYRFRKDVGKNVQRVLRSMRRPVRVYEEGRKYEEPHGGEGVGGGRVDVWQCCGGSMRSPGRGCMRRSLRMYEEALKEV